MSSKIFFTDIDGTLVDDKKVLTPLTKDTLIKMTQAGHYIAISSGRPLLSVIEVAAQLDIPKDRLYYIASNGGVIVEAATGRALMKKTLTFAQMEHLFEVCEQLGLHCHTYSDTAIVSKRQSKELDFYQITVHMPSLITQDITAALTEPPLKCIAISIDGRDRLEHLKEILTPWAQENNITLLFSSDKLLEMFPADSGKGQAVYELSRHLGVPLADTLAAGDQENDISMIEAAGVGVAMKNGADHVKEIADRVTETTNNEDGLVPILREFFEV